MKTLLLSLPVLLFASPWAFADDKSPVPGKAEWDLRAFGTLFKVADTQYDAQKGTLTWTLELKDDIRTADLVRDLDKDRVFQLVFADEDMKELAIIQMRASKFKGIPLSDKITKRGTKLDLTIEIPNVLEKTKQVTLSRVRGQ